jgi:hypothetical protein
MAHCCALPPTAALPAEESYSVGRPFGVRQALSASPTWPLQSSLVPAALAGAAVSAAFKRRQLASGAPVMPLHSFGVPAPLAAGGFRLRFSCWQVASAVPVMPLQSCVAPRGASVGATDGAPCANATVAAPNASTASMDLDAIFMMFSATSLCLHFPAMHRRQ